MVRKRRRRVNGPKPRDPADFRIWFGKHEGQRLGDLPPHYLLWLADEADSDTLRAMARKVLGADEDDAADPHPDPSPATAATTLPLVVFKFQQTLRAEFATDERALAVVERAVRELKSLCSGFTNRPWPDEAGGQP
jgi:hypothetical protein